MRSLSLAELLIALPESSSPSDSSNKEVWAEADLDTARWHSSRSESNRSACAESNDDRMSVLKVVATDRRARAAAAETLQPGQKNARGW
jgi:hypothetical protein